MSEKATTFDFSSVTDESLSPLVRGLVGSEVLRIAAQIRTMLAAGKPICNLTVGDFDPKEFPLPRALLAGVVQALEAGHTNYPPSNGVLELRQSASRYYQRELGLNYPIESVLIASGARPLIYATYKTLVEPGETVAFPVPSWNNNHYTYLVGANALKLPVSRETNFHPTPEQIAEILPKIRLLSLCTPLNPTGTRMSAESLARISHLIVEENKRRQKTGERPVFLLFDQVYWTLDFEVQKPATPPGLVPEVAPYTVVLDAISKSMAATGLRVGWSFAAPAVTARMSDFIGHVGAWAPKAEQVAVASFLDNHAALDEFRAEMHTRLRSRLELLYQGIEGLRLKGYPVEAVKPEGTLYLSARFGLFGQKSEGKELQSNEEIRKFILEKAGIGMVPFQAFGLAREDGWFRLSVGAVSLDAIQQGLTRLETMLAQLSE
jgi:aspartate aminotransferase